MSNRIHIWSSSVAGPRVLLKVEKPVGLPALVNAPFERRSGRSAAAAVVRRQRRVVAHATEDEGTHARVGARVEVEVEQAGRGERPVGGGLTAARRWSACADRAGRRSAAGSPAPRSRRGTWRRCRRSAAPGRARCRRRPPRRAPLRAAAETAGDGAPGAPVTGEGGAVVGAGAAGALGEGVGVAWRRRRRRCPARSVDPPPARARRDRSSAARPRRAAARSVIYSCSPARPW